MPKFEVGVWKYITVEAPDAEAACTAALELMPGDGWQTVDEPTRVPEPGEREVSTHPSDQ